MSSAQARLYEPVTFVELLADGSLSDFHTPEANDLTANLGEIYLVVGRRLAPVFWVR